MPLDDLDRYIINCMSRGVFSYSDLAETCKTTRSTIYRRVKRLEDLGILDKKFMGLVNFEKLNLSGICIGMDVKQGETDEALNVLRDHEPVKLLLKSYGAYHLFVMVLCEKGREGETISTLRGVLSKFHLHKFDVSIGFEWAKVDFTPFSD
jgi:DNA-binding Lrp family transcriptional regulator